MFSESCVNEAASKLGLDAKQLRPIIELFESLSKKVSMVNHTKFLIVACKAHFSLSDDLQVDQTLVNRAITAIHQQRRSLTTIKEIRKRMSLAFARYGGLLQFCQEKKEQHLMLAAVYRCLHGTEEKKKRCISETDLGTPVTGTQPRRGSDTTACIISILGKIDESERCKYIPVLLDLTGDMSQEDAAKACGKSIENYRVFKSRTLEKIRKLLEGKGLSTE